MVQQFDSYPHEDHLCGPGGGPAAVQHVLHEVSSDQVEDIVKDV